MSRRSFIRLANQLPNSTLTRFETPWNSASDNPLPSDRITIVSAPFQDFPVFAAAASRDMLGSERYFLQAADRDTFFPLSANGPLSRLSRNDGKNPEF
jgi:hypothetical protein